MPALAEFLKGTVEESLKKLIAPAGLIPAALFVLLNLAFVYPAAREEKVAVALDFEGLASAWQIAAVAAAVFVIGYIVASASSGVLDTLSGRTWNLSLSHRVLSALRNKRRDALDRRIKRGAGGGGAIEPLDEAKWRRLSRFAPKSDRSAPTALGDVLLATDGLAQDRFGMAPAAVWEPMRATVAHDDEAAKIAGEQKAGVDLMAGLWLAFTAFFFECAVLFSLWGKPDKVLLSLLALPPAFVAYRVTVTKTISWADGVMNVLALHHEKLRGALGLRKPADAADRRALWTSASNFLMDDFKPAMDSIYALDDPVGPKVRATGNLKVDAQSAATRAPADGTSAAAHAAGVDHTLFVTTVGAADAATITGSLTISDPRIERIPTVPAVAASGATVIRTVMSAPSPEVTDTLLLHISGLGADDAAALSFHLPRWQLGASGGLVLEMSELGNGDLHGKLVNRTAQTISGATLTLFHVRSSLCTVVLRAPTGTVAPATGGGVDTHRWTVGELTPDSELALSIELSEQEAN